MGWIKEANKIGKYQHTYGGFRIYCTQEPYETTGEIERDGKTYVVTEFHSGYFVAIDNTGCRIEGKNLEAIGVKIDSEQMRRYFSKKEGVELVWIQRK